MNKHNKILYKFILIGVFALIGAAVTIQVTIELLYNYLIQF